MNYEPLEKRARTDLHVCKAKGYIEELKSLGEEIPNSCTESCDGQDTQCPYWIGQYGINGKGWKPGEWE